VVPEIVHFLLGLTPDLKRNRFGEFENRPTVQCGEGLSIQLEGHDHHRTRRAAMMLLPRHAIAGDGGDFRIPEYRDIEIGGFFGLMVEPKRWGDDIFHKWMWNVPVVRRIKMSQSDNLTRKAERCPSISRKVP